MHDIVHAIYIYHDPLPVKVLVRLHNAKLCLVGPNDFHGDSDSWWRDGQRLTKLDIDAPTAYTLSNPCGRHQGGRDSAPEADHLMLPASVLGKPAAG